MDTKEGPETPETPEFPPAPEAPGGIEAGEPPLLPPGEAESPTVPASRAPTLAGIPWEERERWGGVNAFWRTLRQSMFSPQGFFRRLPPRGTYGPPILYALLTGVTGVIGAYLWTWWSGNLGTLMGTLHERISPLVLVGMVVSLAPIIILTLLFLWSCVIHLMLVLLGSAHHGFDATFRALAYAQGPEILQVLPLCGSPVGAVWKLVLQVIGLAMVHNTSMLRSAVAVFLPLILCGGLVMALGGLAILAGLWGYE